MAGIGFRMQVLGADPFVSRENMKSMGVEKCESLSDLLPVADLVSLHAVLNSETRHLIGRPELELMKPSAILINVSRGALVDEAALLDALLAGRWLARALMFSARNPFP